MMNAFISNWVSLALLCLEAIWGGSAAAQERPIGPRRPLPLLEVKTNALYWATSSLNAGFETGLTPDISLVIDAGYNPWTFGDNRKFKFWLLQPEVRHWFGCRSEGHFLGVHFLYAGFNVGGVKFLGMADRRYEGSLYGAGVAYGYGLSESVGASRLRRLWAICGRTTNAMYGSGAAGISAGDTKTTSDRRK